MAAALLTANMGDTLDAMIWRTFARGSGMVEAVYAANRDLARQGPILTEGTVVTVPDTLFALPQTDEVKLWD